MRGGAREIAHVERLRVDLDLEGARRTVGTLAWSLPNRTAFFQYDPAFLAAPLPLSPFKLPADARVLPGHPVFEGLHGLFSDSLPDGWGRKLLDRRLSSAGYDARRLTPLDRLAFVGERGMGALRYIPENPDGETQDVRADLDFLSDEARRIENDEPQADISKLVGAQGGSGGARPKIVVGLEPATGKLLLDCGQELPRGYERWLVKFRSMDDPREIGAEEYAYARMAQAAGVGMAETRLLRTGKDVYFAVKRFDRSAAGRHHVHTAAGLVDADFRVPGAIDYEALLKMTWALTKNAAHVEQMFRRMVFNVLAHNRDDHARNHAFLMNGAGEWSPTPAYDLTFSNGPAGEHNLAVAGEGRNPGRAHILQAARETSMGAARASAILEEVQGAIALWPSFADEAGLSRRRSEEINGVLNGRKPAPRPSG